VIKRGRRSRGNQRESSVTLATLRNRLTKSKRLRSRKRGAWVQ
jgi:hypothetical protein